MSYVTNIPTKLSNLILYECVAGIIQSIPALFSLFKESGPVCSKFLPMFFDPHPDRWPSSWWSWYGDNMGLDQAPISVLGVSMSWGCEAKMGRNIIPFLCVLLTSSTRAQIGDFNTAGPCVDDSSRMCCNTIHHDCINYFLVRWPCVPIQWGWVWQYDPVWLSEELYGPAAAPAVWQGDGVWNHTGYSVSLWLWLSQEEISRM